MRILRAIGTLLSLYFMVRLSLWVVSYAANPTPQGIERAGTLIAEAAVPWWLPALEALAPIGGGILAVLVLFFLSRMIAQIKY